MLSLGAVMRWEPGSWSGTVMFWPSRALVCRTVPLVVAFCSFWVLAKLMSSNKEICRCYFLFVVVGMGVKVEWSADIPLFSLPFRVAFCDCRNNQNFSTSSVFVSHTVNTSYGETSKEGNAEDGSQNNPSRTNLLFRTDGHLYDLEYAFNSMDLHGASTNHRIVNHSRLPTRSWSVLYDRHWDTYTRRVSWRWQQQTPDVCKRILLFVEFSK